MSKAQSVDDIVYEQLRKVAQGKVAEVRKALPDLLLEYPNSPGILFLHGVVAHDAVKALPLYEKIVQEHPESRWADDALWRIVQIYAVTGDTAQARRWLQEFEHRYPTSEYLLFARLLVKETVGLPALEQVDAAADTAGQIPVPPTLRAPRYNNQPPAEVPDFPPRGGQAPATPLQPGQTPPAAPVPKTLSTPESPSAPVPVPPVDTVPKVRYGLQVGIYRMREAAAKELLKYQRLNLRAEIIEKQMGGEPHYAVVIGDYGSIEDAERAKKVVARFCQCKPFLIVK